MNDHLMPTHFQRPDVLKDPLYVVTVISNQVRYRSRWKLYEDFAKRVAESGAILYTVEIAFGEREFVEPCGPRYLKLRTTSELWHKENALNLLVSHLPLDWKYVATVDADIAFARDDWANETLHQLQHYPIVQMFASAQDLDANHDAISEAQSFAYCYVHHLPRGDQPGYYIDGQLKKYLWHPGYCWAYRREAWDQLGQLIDHAILGAADNHMAYALIGEAESTIKANLTQRYKDLVLLWQDRAEQYIKRNIGYVPGLILHYWHGPKASRRYHDRWKILEYTQYNPDLDLKRDWQGLYQLTDRSPELRQLIRAYFRQRDEDSTSTDPLWAESMITGKGDL